MTRNTLNTVIGNRIEEQMKKRAVVPGPKVEGCAHFDWIGLPWKPRAG